MGTVQEAIESLAADIDLLSALVEGSNLGGIIALAEDRTTTINKILQLIDEKEE